MKKVLVLTFLFFIFQPVFSQKTIRSNIRNIKILINNKENNWTISPDVNPDRLKVYCDNERNLVIFQTDIDTAKFYVRKNDTLKLKINLKNKGIANTEIIGIKDLPNAIRTEEKIYWLSQIWSETKYNFVNIDRLSFNIDSLYSTYIPQIIKTKNDYEFYRTLQKFVSTLHDGHSQVYMNQFYPFKDYIPMNLSEFDKRVYITSIRKNAGLDSAWLGAEVIEIGGLPTKQYLEKNVFPYLSASTNQHLWMQAIYSIQNDLKTNPFFAKIEKANGQIQNIKVNRNGEATRTPNDEYWQPPVTSYPKSKVELKWLTNKIAYVNISSFDPDNEIIKEFDKIAKDLYTAKGLIIDLRLNGGGSTRAGWHIQKYLCPQKYFLNFSWESRVNDGVKKANGNWREEYKSYFLNKAYRFEKADTIYVPDSLKRINCPVAILIGSYTFSAAEDFLVNLYETSYRPLLIGEETGGSTGSPLFVGGLPGGGSFRICTRRICFPYSNNRFVNAGIKPDIEIKQTIQDYFSNKDVVLERAISELVKK